MPAQPRDGRPREKPERIADAVRSMIVTGELVDGEALGREPELIQRFGVSRPSLREALRILEAEGLISVVRGAGGGVIVHEPDERMTARTAALVMRSRNVPLADVSEARRLLEPPSVRTIAESTRRRAAVEELAALVDQQEAAIDEPEEFGRVNSKFHDRLVALAGNEALTIVAEMLNEVVARAVTDVSAAAGPRSARTRRRGIRSQRRLLQYIAEGDGAAAEDHWREHVRVVGRVLTAPQGASVVDLHDHY